LIRRASARRTARRLASAGGSALARRALSPADLPTPALSCHFAARSRHL